MIQTGKMSKIGLIRDTNIPHSQFSPGAAQTKTFKSATFKLLTLFPDYSTLQTLYPKTLLP